MTFRPKSITFDCYGTLTNFRLHEIALDMYQGMLPAEQLRQFVRDFAAYRLDEVMGDWKPYVEVLKSALTVLPTGMPLPPVTPVMLRRLGS